MTVSDVQENKFLKFSKFSRFKDCELLKWCSRILRDKEKRYSFLLRVTLICGKFPDLNAQYGFIVLILRILRIAATCNACNTNDQNSFKGTGVTNRGWKERSKLCSLFSPDLAHALLVSLKS